MAKLTKKRQPDNNTFTRTESALSIVGSQDPLRTNFETLGASAKFGSFQRFHGKRVSDTMQMALASTSITTTSRNVFTATSSSNTDSSNLYPRSQSEQYWAVRALTAETLLSARKEHFEDLQTVTILQETKRVTEVAQLTKLYDERLVKLEKLLVILLGVLFILTFSVFFSHLASTHGGQKDSISRSQWAHFTIPILSPFASVVEHEVSVVGSKTILGLCLIIASLAYVLLRHWKNGGQRAG